MKYFTKLTFLLLVAGFFSSCEKQEYFKSESEIEEDLAYSWKQELMSLSYDEFETWTFTDGKINIKYQSTSTGLPTKAELSGTYSINTTMTKVFINLADFPDNEGSYFYNAEWTVVMLDNKSLVVASEDPHAGGVQQRDFTRID